MSSFYCEQNFWHSNYKCQRRINWIEFYTLWQMSKLLQVVTNLLFYASLSSLQHLTQFTLTKNKFPVKNIQYGQLYSINIIMALLVYLFLPSGNIFGYFLGFIYGVKSNWVSFAQFCHSGLLIFCGQPVHSHQPPWNITVIFKFKVCQSWSQSVRSPDQTVLVRGHM